ncbi:MAG: UDP-N-acetylmuramate dehydrogenase [Candidatus Saccharimonadales bacterium]
MNIETNVSLADYSTMKLGGRTKYLAVINTKQDLIEAINYASQNRLKILTVGEGANIIWRDEGFNGLVLVCRIRGFEVESEDDEGADVLIGGGENWDLIVDRVVSLGLSGIECLSLIPGTAGATPVQNVGAYGQEIADTFVSLEAYDNTSNNFLTMLNKDCDFSYRNSCFKKQPGRYFILSIRLHLRKRRLTPPLYKALDQYLNEHQITDLSPVSIRSAVVAIRESKLPDPKRIKNCGSFFENPIVSLEVFKDLVSRFPDIPHWNMKDNTVKMSAAWLIEQVGYKDYSDASTGISTWKNQPLILINVHARSTADLLRFKDRIATDVFKKFNILLEQEPELLP